jgi:hypothetical protein
MVGFLFSGGGSEEYYGAIPPWPAMELVALSPYSSSYSYLPSLCL